MDRFFGVVLLAVATAVTASAQSDGDLQASVHRALESMGTPSGLNGSVTGGIVSFTGSVGLLSSKLDAESAVARLQGVRGIRDRVQVVGPKVEDAELRAELDKKVHNRRIQIAVHDGQIALRSGRLDPVTAEAALHAVADTPGVLSLVNRLDVIPWGPGPGGASYSISSVP